MGVHAFRLNENEINNALFNMIISQQVFADNIAGSFSSLVEKAKTDGGLFGDTKVYYSTDVIRTHKWLNDAEAANLLELERNKKVSIDKIVLDQFVQIRCTVDDYLSKRAFGGEGVFGSYNAVLLGWIRDTKKVHDSKMYNVFIGTNKSNVEGTKQNIEVTLPAHSAGETNVEAEAVNRLRAQTLAKKIADLVVDMRDATRDYNDNKYLRSYDDSAIKVIWNSDYVNSIDKLSLPTIFNKDGLMVKMSEDILPGKYFGDVQGAITESGNDGTYRSMEEISYGTGANEVHIFAGDLIPAGYAIESGKSYKENAKKICVVVKELPPFMSAFETGSSFWNPRALVTTHYLTYGYNTLKHLKEMPYIVIKEA